MSNTRNLKDIKYHDPKDISLITPRNSGGKGSWITASKDMLYISRGNGGRSYWILSKIRPKMVFNDKNLSIQVGANKIIVKSIKKYEKLKKTIIKNEGKKWVSKGVLSRRKSMRRRLMKLKLSKRKLSKRKSMRKSMRKST